MNKKILFSIFIGFSLFMFFDNVKAATTEITLNTAIDQEELLNNFFVTKEEIGIDETVFQNAINSFNIDTDKYDYIISYRKNSSTSIYLYCWKWEKSSTFEAEPSISFLDYTGNQNMYWFNFVVRFSSGKSYELSYDIYNDKKGSSFNYISIENNIIGFNYDSNKKLKYMRSVYRILETSIDLKMGTSALYDYNTISYNPKRIKDFMIDDGELCYSIKKGDIFFDKDLSPSWIPKTHSYEGIIETKDKSKIEINFTIPSDENFSFDLDFEMDYSYGLLSKPYIEYSVANNSNIIDFITSDEKSGATDSEGNEIYHIIGKYGQNLTFNQNLKSIKIVLDVSSTIDDIYLKFSSKLNYTFSYEYTVDTNQYFKTIQMEDIYGLYLIPKTLNQDNRSTIYMYGKYDIGMRGINEKEYSFKLEKYDKSNFIYDFKNNPFGQLVFFENLGFSNDSDTGYYITFDIRYFSYAIRENPYDEPIINNPNTGEDIKIDFNDSINNSESFSKTVYNIFSSFLPSIEEVIKLATIWFNSLPGLLKYFYMFLFLLTIAYLLLKFLI